MLQKEIPDIVPNPISGFPLQGLEFHIYFQNMSLDEDIFQMIKLSLNGLVIFISFKKNDISGNNKFLVYLIIQPVCLGVFFVPQENASFASSTKLVSSLLRNQGITGGTKNSEMPD